jgi:integrase
MTLSTDRGALQHDVPLSAPVAAILSSVPEIGKKGYLFTISGERPFTAYSDVKRRMDARLEALNKAPIPGWTFHDLRRTAASGMARLGIPVNVIESVLNHRSGQVSGVTAIYNRYAYHAEMRSALDAWAGHVMGLVGDPPASNVTPFRREG